MPAISADISAKRTDEGYIVSVNDWDFALSEGANLVLGFELNAAGIIPVLVPRDSRLAVLQIAPDGMAAMADSEQTFRYNSGRVGLRVSEN